jgi:hypothetical protein
MEFTVIDGCLIAMLAIVLLCFVGANNQRKRELSKAKRLHDCIASCAETARQIEKNGAAWYISPYRYLAQPSDFDSMRAAVLDTLNEANEIINELPLPL